MTQYSENQKRLTFFVNGIRWNKLELSGTKFGMSQEILVSDGEMELEFIKIHISNHHYLNHSSEKLLMLKPLVVANI